MMTATLLIGAACLAAMAAGFIAMIRDWPVGGAAVGAPRNGRFREGGGNPALFCHSTGPPGRERRVV